MNPELIPLRETSTRRQQLIPELIVRTGVRKDRQLTLPVIVSSLHPDKTIKSGVYCLDRGQLTTESILSTSCFHCVSATLLSRLVERTQYGMAILTVLQSLQALQAVFIEAPGEEEA